MRIFATADLHGDIDQMRQLKSAAKDADLLLICGDIGGKNYDYDTKKGYGSIREAIFCTMPKTQEKDAKKLDAYLNKLPIPSYYILGNDDWFETDSQHRLTQPIDVGGFTLVPFEYVGITPFTTNREANENKLMYELCQLKTGKKTIMVAHVPPHGVCDILFNGEHAGSKAVREWIHAHEPMLWLCGHIHESFGKGQIGNTAIYNCTTICQSKGVLRGWLIDTDTGEAEEKTYGPKTGELDILRVRQDLANGHIVAVDMQRVKRLGDHPEQKRGVAVLPLYASHIAVDDLLDVEPAFTAKLREKDICTIFDHYGRHLFFADAFDADTDSTVERFFSTEKLSTGFWMQVEV